MVQMASRLLSCKRRKDVCSKTSVIASRPRSLNDLPEEILLNVFSHFEPEDLCLIIAKVCERWNILAKDVVLWKALSYYCDDDSDYNDIEAVLTVAPALHSLTICDRKDAARILELLFPINVNIRKVILKCCDFGKDSTFLLANVVDLYPDLEVLSLEGCYPLSSAGYGLIPRLTKLSELNLSYCEQQLSGETVRVIADSCQHLKKLRLCGVRLIDGDVIHVIKKLGKHLTTLLLDGTKLTDVVYSYLKNCARLQELEVYCCHKMTDKGLLEGIGSLHELSSLRLDSGRSLTAQALSTFLHRPSMCSMVLLDLSCSNLDDEGLKGIAERCIHLKELEFTFCEGVTDAGISMVISHCSQLRKLILNCLDSVRGNGWMALVPLRLPHLIELSLLGCINVHAGYVQELRAAAPELEISK